MFKKYCLLFCLHTFFLCRVSAQVNLQTGSATFTLPMFSWQDDKSRLNSVVALNYSSGNGLKVDDVASNVGQGWSLIAGGSITRIQVGEPDDQKAYYSRITNNQPEIPEDETKYPNGYLFNPANDIYDKGCPLALTNYPLFGDKNHTYKQHNAVSTDRELDYFAFQFNGRSGMFVLNKSDDNNCLVIGDSRLIISFTRDYTLANNTTSGIRTFITAFTIKDENGLIYKFTKQGFTKVLKTGYCDANHVDLQTQPKFKHGKVYFESSFDKNTIINPYIISSWYLTEIEDALTHRKITFSYSKTLNIEGNAGANLAYYAENNYSIISYKSSKTTVPQLSSIAYQDGHLVTFNYGNERVDLLHDTTLASVDISYNGRFLSEYQLNTSYFILNRYGTPTSDYQKKVARLCLRSVKKIGVDFRADENPYIFDYYLTSKSNPDPDDYVPPPFSFFKDIWGFYNGSYYDATTGTVKGSSAFKSNGEVIPLNTSLFKLKNYQIQGLCFLSPDVSNTTVLNPRDGYAKNGLLRQIIYPTGGTLTYEYEQNVGTLSGQIQDQMVGGVHVSRTSVTDGGYSNNCNNPIVTNYDYILSTTGPSSLWGLEKPDNSMVFYNHYDPEYKYWHYEFPFGSCSFHYQYPGILARENKVELGFWGQLLQAVSPVLNVVSAISSVQNAANLLGITSGFGSLYTAIIDIITGVIEIGLTCFTNFAKDNTSTIYYNLDLNSSNPLPAQFKRVEVVQNSGAIGKTVQQFTNPDDDYPVWEPVNPSFSMKQRYAPWAYGLPKLTTDYDVNGYIVKQVENRYDFSKAKNYAIGFKDLLNIGSCKCFVQKNNSQRNTNWANDMVEANNTYVTPNTYSDIIVDPYYVYTGRVEDTSTYERIYKPTSSSQYLETVTRYEYNYSNYLVSKVTTIQSSGDENYKEIKYTSDYSGTTIDVMKSNNILVTPVESASSLKKNGSSSVVYLNEKVTEFTQLANGDIKPLRILEQRFDRPQNMTKYIGPGNSSNPIYKETQTFTYEGISGNLIGMKDEGNHIVTNIYDYNDKYIIASVINADPLLDKPAYTSFETPNFGGWVLTGTPTYASSSITGASSLILSTGKNLKVSALNTARSYRLSLWATSAATVAGNAILVKSGPSINGFTYYEYDIAAGTVTVTVSGTTTIDELRLYPATARMRTVTYDELIGKTAECDENNRITYFEYDELGRQKFIRDENKNILKMYEYNTVSNKQNGCPGTYTNNQISEIFTKSDCGAGYIGSDVTYAVPPGRYSSSISQADADQKAENEVNANGQAYANTNGTCIKLYYNIATSGSFTTEGCDVGYVGGIKTYSVPANKYTSTISQADADQLAQDEIDANGQAYANSIANRVCNISTVADWEGPETAQVRCQKDGYGSFTGHQEAYLTDVNPNSSTYNQPQWKDVGPNETSCPPTQGYSPGLNIGDHSKTTYGVITGQPGTTKTITLTLNSSLASAVLTGYVGFNVQLNGSGQHSITQTVTIPSVGYISWNLSVTISGTLVSGQYVSTSMQIQ